VALVGLAHPGEALHHRKALALAAAATSPASSSVSWWPAGWTVHTTVRSLAREAALRQLLAVDDSRLRVFAADLTADAGWADAMAGCSHVAHLASPLPAGVPRSADEVIVPARDGVLRALRAARPPACSAS
jgi:hypothetical protein